MTGKGSSTNCVELIKNSIHDDPCDERYTCRMVADENSEFLCKWDSSVDSAASLAMNALMAASDEDSSLFRSSKTSYPSSNCNKIPQITRRSSIQKQILIPSMTPVSGIFFTDDDFDFLPIIGSGTSTAFAKAALNLEKELDRRVNLNTNVIEMDVLDVEQESILRLTQCIIQNINQRIMLNNHDHQILRHKMERVDDAFEILKKLGEYAPRRVCQHPFRKNDIVWVCRTCQADETCVLCHKCWIASDHVGHDTSFYHAQAGGCCDCGDPDAWDPDGFCPLHGMSEKVGSESTYMTPDKDGRIKGLPWTVVADTRGVVRACLDWIVENIAIECNQSFVTLGSDNDRIMILGHSDASVIAPSGNEISSDASNSSISSESETIYEKQAKQTVEYLLGERGRKGRGLFLVAHSSDMVSRRTLVDALRLLYSSQLLGFMFQTSTGLEISRSISESVVKKIAQVIESSGDVVLLGTNDILHVIGASPILMSQLWRDGDEMTLKKVGEVMIRWAKILCSNGITCSIKTYKQLKDEQQAYAVLEWLGHTARCDALCEQISLAVSQEQHLEPMLKFDLRLPRRITRAYHSLQLTLLVVPDFKKQLSNAYCDMYETITAEYVRGVGVTEYSSYTLSVQFLNRPIYVQDLVRNRNLLLRLTKSFLSSLVTATNSSLIDAQFSAYPRALNPQHLVLKNRRYSPVVNDLKYVLNVNGIPQIFCILMDEESPLKVWIDALSLAQCLHAQCWRVRSQGHIEMEDKGWVAAFNLSICFNSLYDRILSWNDDESNSGDLIPNVSFFDASTLVLNSIDSWFQDHVSDERYSATFDPPTIAAEILKSGIQTSQVLDPFEADHMSSPQALPVCAVSVNNGMSTLCLPALSVSQICPISFHIPLHRFFGCCLREICCGSNNVGDKSKIILEKLIQDANDRVENDDVNLHKRSVFRDLMEFPVLILSRAAQIRAGLWRRNGQGMSDQILNYMEAPFCRGLRDLDLLLIQFSCLGYNPFSAMAIKDFKRKTVGCAYVINLMLHRFGLFEFLGFMSATPHFQQRYSTESSSGYYRSEKCNSIDHSNNLHSNNVSLKLPWCYSPAGRLDKLDVRAALALLEELLHVFIMLITELPSVPISRVKNSTEKCELTCQARKRLRREVVHRLASGPKTFSELAEIHHVLSPKDNSALNEEGRMQNPDEAAEAALNQVLTVVANELPVQGFDSKKWELKQELWCEYDPSYFHISQRAHQAAAELRPNSFKRKDRKEVDARPFCPRPAACHPSFERLRKDLTIDAAFVSILYRILHVHCSENPSSEALRSLRGKRAYDQKAMSDLALSRVIQLLTLGAYAWEKDEASCFPEWHCYGGGGEGSLFHKYPDLKVPSAKDWVETVLIGEPSKLMGNDFYNAEPCILEMLQKVAINQCSRFKVQDSALCEGAEWLCKFSEKWSAVAAKMISGETKVIKEKESELDRRKRLAKEKYMKLMDEQAKKFIAGFPKISDDDIDEIEDDIVDQKIVEEESDIQNTASLSAGKNNIDVFSIESDLDESDKSKIETKQLLRDPPICIICNSYDLSRKKDSMLNELAFCAHAQCSTVLKGGGGPYQESNRHVGIHLALCGHAVHYSCIEPFLKTGHENSSDRREDMKWGEFRCPCCQRLSSCLIPFVNVNGTWTRSSVGDEEVGIDSCYLEDFRYKELPSCERKTSFQAFLDESHWTKSCFFIKKLEGDDEEEKMDSNRGRLLRGSLSHITDESYGRKRKSSHVGSSSESIGMMKLWHHIATSIHNIAQDTDRNRLGKSYVKGRSELGRRDRNQKGAKSDTAVFDIFEGTALENGHGDFISSLLAIIQSFVYSCCAEAADIRYQAESLSKERIDFAKFGIGGVCCNNLIIEMPKVSFETHTESLFDGKLGKLRNVALTIIALSSTKFITKDIIDATFFGRLTKNSDSNSIGHNFHPLLHSHILSITVASIFACCGYKVKNAFPDKNEADSVLELEECFDKECMHFVKLGFLSRVLQVLTSECGISSKSAEERKRKQYSLLNILGSLPCKEACNSNSLNWWSKSCTQLLLIAFSSNSEKHADSSSSFPESSMNDLEVMDMLEAAFEKARITCEIFLADLCLILQIIIPFIANERGMFLEKKHSFSINKLFEWFQFEPIDEMVKFPFVQVLIRHWYNDALSHEKVGSKDNDSFRGKDWPLMSSDMIQSKTSGCTLFPSPSSDIVADLGSLTPAHTSNDLVPLFGVQFRSNESKYPYISAIPISYTDLYASVSVLCPEMEHVAICLVCGEIVDTGGKGQCTLHAMKCGGGCGIFFLLQECKCLILDNSRAAYLKSPFVDSHGETPQFRGRPLNLCLQRYELLKNLWTGHMVREKVRSERNIVRHLIIRNYY